MNNLTTEINKIRSYFTDEELRRTFIHRLDDNLFWRVGRLSLGAVEARKMEKWLVCWRGFELLLQIDKGEV